MRLLASLTVLCLSMTPAMGRSGHASGHDGEGSQPAADVVRSVEGLNPRQALEVKAASGVETRVGRSWNCVRKDHIPFITVIENPDHGTVEVRDLPNGSPCGDGPIRGVLYKSQAGYRGVDHVRYRVNSDVGGGETFTKDIVVE